MGLGDFTEDSVGIIDVDDGLLSLGHSRGQRTKGGIEPVPHPVQEVASTRIAGVVRVSTGTSKLSSLPQ